MKVPEQHRFRDKRHPMGSDSSYGNQGVFIIPLSNTTTAQCIASDGIGWDHVSVTINDKKLKTQRTPTWAEMCKIKDLFWDEDETVIQYHPPRSEYVNNHKFCLHLWKPAGVEIPLPPSEMVGLKNKLI